MTSSSFTRIRGGVWPAAALLAWTVMTPPVSLAGVPDRKLAAAAASGSTTVLPPVSIPYGKTYDQWSVLWWQRFLPLTGQEFAGCTIGAGDYRVAFLLGGTGSCTGRVSADTALFFPIATVDCSNLEDPPFHGGTAADRDACANGWFSLLPTGNLSVEIDGAPVQNPTSYQAISADFPFVVGPDNVFGMACGASRGGDRNGRTDACAGQATAYGYYLMLAPLPLGTHTIHIVAEAFGIDTTWTITVGR